MSSLRSDENEVNFHAIAMYCCEQTTLTQFLHNLNLFMLLVRCLLGLEHT
jgi:hypothetical protein